MVNPTYSSKSRTTNSNSKNILHGHAHIDGKQIGKISNKLVGDYYQFIVTALGLVAALAWNSAFQNFFQKNKYLHNYGPWAYAALVTLVILILIQVFDLLKKKVYIDLDNNNIPDIVL